MTESPTVTVRPRWVVFTLVMGVILPSASILVETTTHVCAEHFFDPIPTLWHVLLAEPGKNMTEDAVSIAARYQLVTPVSGAVVLETSEQYSQAGLRPVEPGSVPTIPELEVVLLLLVAAALLTFAFFSHRPARRRTA